MSCTNDPVEIYKKLSIMLKRINKFKPNYNLIESFSSQKIALKLLKTIENTVNNDFKKL